LGKITLLATIKPKSIPNSVIGVVSLSEDRGLTSPKVPLRLKLRDQESGQGKKYLDITRRGDVCSRKHRTGAILFGKRNHKGQVIVAIAGLV
jgi:hypothetical protein